MRRTIDLSGPLFEGMWSYNSLPTLAGKIPEFSHRQVTSIASSGAEVPALQYEQPVRHIYRDSRTHDRGYLSSE